MWNERRAEYFGYISSCQLPVFWQAISGGWIIRLLHFSSVASSHWVGNEKCHFQMSVFTSFIFFIIIYCLSLTVSVFSPVVSALFWNLRLLKCLFFLFLRLLWPRSSLLIYSSCYHGSVRWHKAQRGRYTNDRFCPCVLLLFWLFCCDVCLHMNFSTFSCSHVYVVVISVFVLFTEVLSYPSA